MNRDTSPRAAGPSGSQFEAKVATHYALAVLARTEAFGLPGATVDRLEFQRRGQGHPLDDIIVTGTTIAGERRCLEVQAKRSMSFTEADGNFLSIVAGIVDGRRADPARRFAVAIERTSGPIENGVQEVLELARHSTNSDGFLTLLNTPGRSNSDMRRFAGALKNVLARNGSTEDAAVFDVARAFSVLVFDYARPNSIAEHHDRGRARHLASATSQGDPYDVLFGLVLRSDAIGGEIDRAQLIEALHERGVDFGRLPNLAKARGSIEEMSRLALREITRTVSGQQLARADRRRRLEDLLVEAEAQSGVVEITGPGGVGKSGLLRAVAEGRRISSRILVLAPDRTPAGGWPALRREFEIDATAEEFLQDLSCDGGGLICVDGLDRFRDEGQRKTVIDVVSTAVGVKGVMLLFTARTGWEDEAGLLFGEELMASLSIRHTFPVEGLDDNEARDLAEAAPTLAPLLRPDHPARALARNPFILRRLASTRLDTERVLSEAELAWDWWKSGGHAVGMAHGDIHARRRVLLGVAQGLLLGEALVGVSLQDPTAVATLISEDVLVQTSTDRVKFQHDLLADWAIACALSEDPERMTSIAAGELPPFWLSRGFELAFRRLAEGDDDQAWQNAFKTLEHHGAKNGWTGLALLALVRSEHSGSLLERYAETLLEGDGDLAARLVHRVISSHGQPAATVLKDVFPTSLSIPKSLTLPAGPQWPELMAWCVAQFDRLPPKALAAAIGLFEGWLTLTIFGEKAISPVLLERLADVLVADIEARDLPRPRPGEPRVEIKYAVGRDALETARLQLALFARSCPSAAARYISAIGRSNHALSEMRQLLEFPGQLASAAPAAFCSAFQGAIRLEEDEEEEDHGLDHRRGRSRDTESYLEGPFLSGRCGITLFSDILAGDPTQGIELIRKLVRAAEGPATRDVAFSLCLSGQERCISPDFSYGWSRSCAVSSIIPRALQALEYWAHRRIDAGEPLDDVAHEILGDGPVSGAILPVIVDLALSHSSLDGALLADLTASPELLTLDMSRTQHDVADKMTGGSFSRPCRSPHRADAPIEDDLLQRRSRTLALYNAIEHMAVFRPEGATARLRATLAEHVARLGPWTSASVDWTSAVFMASHALRLASKENYDIVSEPTPEGGERARWAFRWPKEQRLLLQEQSSGVAAESYSFNRSLAVRAAMSTDGKPTSIPVADAEAVLAATSDATPRSDGDRDDQKDAWLNRVAAAAFMARFSTDDVVASRRAMLLEIFDHALQQSAPDLPNLRYHVMYDAPALAVAGLIYLASRLTCASDHRALLEAVGSHSASAAAAFSHHRQAAEALGDERLRAVIRVGLQSCVVTRRKRFDENETAFETRQSKRAEMHFDRMQAEIDWLAHGGGEPTWPSPPPRRRRRPKRAITLPGGKPKKPRPRPPATWPDYYFDDRTAAAWLRTLALLPNVHRSAVIDLLKANRDWLLGANGLADEDEDEADLEGTWTRSLFECAATRAKSWTDEERASLIYEVLDQFSDEAFIASGAAFLVQSDLTHIAGDVADTAYLADVRQRLWTRLKETGRWRQHVRSPRDGMEVHLKALVAAFFFKVSYGLGEKAYTKGLREDQIAPLLPVLTTMAAASAPCPTIALLFLDVLELVDPKVAAACLVTAAARWSAGGNHRFWNELSIGRRVCAIAELGSTHSSAQQWTEIADAIAATGVAAGEALKQSIRRRSS